MNITMETGSSDTQSAHPDSLSFAAIAARLLAILLPLVTLIARHPQLFGARFQPLVNRLFSGTNRLASRVAALADSPPPRHRASHPRTRAPRPPAIQFPRRRAWLVHVLGYHAAGTAAQLEHLLYSDGVADTLARLPSAGRFLRPLCRLLGVTPPPALALPPRPKPAKPPKPTRPATHHRGTPSRPLYPSRKPRLPLLVFRHA